MSQSLEIAVTYRCGHLAIIRVRDEAEVTELRRIAYQILCTDCELKRLEEEQERQHPHHHHEHHEHHHHHHHAPPIPKGITFTETTMNPTAAGQTQQFTGTLTPAGSAFPSDVEITVTPNDPALAGAVTVDATGLVVTVTYPATWTESTTTPLEIEYSATSPTNPNWELLEAITPSAPATTTPPATNLPTGISFTQSE